MSRSQRVFCRDIIEYIQRIETYTEAGYEVFARSELHQDAVIRCFTVIGEAIKQLSEELIATQPHVDWRGFAGFRDILVHQYHNTDIDVAWTVIQEDLPALKAAIISMFSALDEPPPPTSDEIA